MTLILFLALALGGFAAYALWLGLPAASAHALAPGPRRWLGILVGDADRRTTRVATFAGAGRLSSLQIRNILPESLVIPALMGQTKDAVLRELVEHLALQREDVDANELIAAVLKRERLRSTAIGDGIAMPHAKLAGVNSLVATFGRHVHGVDFGSPDGRPTKLFFLLVAPDDCIGLHVTALARMSWLLKRPTFRDQLLSAVEGVDLYQAIRDEDGKHDMD